MKKTFLLTSGALLAGAALVAQAGSVSGTITYAGEQPGRVHIKAVQSLAGNKVLQVDGTDDTVRVPTLLNLAGSELTIQFWFKGNNMQSAVRQQSGGYIVAGWNKTHIVSNDGGTGGIAAGDAAVDGQWHHVVLTWKQNTEGGFASYLDGKLIASRKSSDTPIPDHQAAVFFGSFDGVGEFAQGRLDEIAIWQRSFTAEEIQANWNHKLAGSEPGLVGYWTFDDGTANDATANGHHGEFYGDAAAVDEDVPGLGGGYALATIDAPGAYSIGSLPDGPGYAVTAYRDANTNEVQNPSEPFGAFAGNPFTLSGDRAGVDVALLEIPRVIEQPVAQRVGVGVSATFKVSALGTAPLTYEWRKDDVALSDGGRIAGSKTAELKITNAQLADNGVYTVVVRNGVGETRSDAAALQVVSGGATISGTITYTGPQSGNVVVTAAQRRTGNKVFKVSGGGWASTTLTDLGGSELTIQFWFRGTVAQSAVRQQSGGYIVSAWNGLHILSNDKGTSGINAGATLTDGQWHQVTMSWKQGTAGGFASYLDGRLVASRDSVDTAVPSLGAQVYFGAWNGQGEFANGEIDEIALWQRALSASEIAANWRSGLQGNEAGLTGYWNFDDGLGQDLTANANHAELGGDAVIVDADIAAMGNTYMQVVPAPGAYQVPYVPGGNGFYVTAFLDSNGNRVQDASEAVGEYAGNPFNLTADKTGVDFVLYDPPVINPSPASLVLAPGATAVFTVGVQGTEPLAYQWQKDGVDLADGGKLSGTKTASLTINSVAAADEGTYRVVVTNPAATVTSDGAALVVAAGMTDRLVGHWKFDETTGITAANSGTGATDGELINFVGDDSQWIAGQVGGALAFGGPEAQTYVVVADYPKPDKVVSASAWVWAESRPTWASIVKNWSSGQVGQFHFGLTDNVGDLSNYIAQQNGAAINARENVVFPLASWQHVAFVCDGAKIRIYRNGVEVGSTPYNGTLLATPIVPMGIGIKLNDDGSAPSGEPGYWHGKMDDVGLWTRALTAAEVNGIYTAGLAGKDLSQATPTPASVSLGVSRSGSNVTISWAPGVIGFTLEASDRVPSGTWTAVPGVVNNQVTVPATGAAQYYRLRK